MSIGLINTGKNFIRPLDRHFSIQNAGWTCTTDTLTIHASDGTDLSPYNPLVVSYEGFTYHFTSNIVVNHSAGAGWDLQGRLDTTASVAWGSVMPLMLGVAFCNDAAAGDYKKACFYFTRDFSNSGVTTSATTQIGKLGTAPSSATGASYILLDSSLTVTEWENCPAFLVGWFPATIDNDATGNIDITVPSSTWPAGIGVFPHGLWFDMPIGQNGNDASNWFISSGTEPVYSTNVDKYCIKVGSGDFKYAMMHTGDGGAEGAGANQLYVRLPYRIGYDYNMPYGAVYLYNGGGTARHLIAFAEGYANAFQAWMLYQSTFTTATTVVSCAMQDNATRTLSMYINGKTFIAI